MNKRFKLMIVFLCLASMTWAQSVKKDSVSTDNDFDYSLTEGQIDEDAEAASTVTLVSSSQDPYMNEVGFLFSPMRFRYRALDNQYVGNYFNGVKLNNVENGRFSYSGITGGLNDAVRNKDGVGFYDPNGFGYSPLGGATNTDLRASHYAAGHKLGLAGTNRNYVIRGTYTYATGVLDNGWSFMGSLAYRWAKEGVIEGTFYNAFSYMVGAEKYINDKHHVSLVTWGAPTERGQQGASTEEAYWLVNSHYYNPYWGYQNGKKRNSRVVTEYSPSVLGTWDFFINKQTKLVTTAAVTFTNYASTALAYNNAYNPRPDYYKNMPSSVLNVYNTEDFNNSDFLNSNPGIYDQYMSLYNNWTGPKANRQVQWDLLYAQNEANNSTGKSALYYVEKRHNDQTAFNFSSNLEGKFNTYGSYLFGINWNTTRGHHYKTMDDLLGANKFIDIDSYTLSDYGSNSIEVQNDVDNPNRNIKEDDIFGYNYLIYVDKLKGYATNTWRKGNMTVHIGADMEGTWMSRYGKMRNGRAAEYSKGSSGWASFLGGGGKINLKYKLGTSFLYTGLAVESQAPLAYNAFVAPRIQNNFVNNLQNELISNYEAGYQWYFGPVSGKVAGYFTQFEDVSQQTAFYNDDAGYLTYLSMTGIKKQYMGLEGAITIKLARNLKLNLIGTLSDAKYVNNPLAQLAYEGSNGDTYKTINTWENPVTGNAQPMRVFMKNVRVGSTPLTAASVGLDYNINGWYFSANLNYYDRVYIDAAAYCRMGKIMDKNQYYTSDLSEVDINTGAISNAFEEARKTGGIVYDASSGEILDAYTAKQEKCKGGFMLDASIGRSIFLKNGKRLSINLQVQNITNNTNLKTGGYEQNRADRSTYIFSKNSYYYYANAINAFLNVSLKF
ncbi:MAG: TonB-dependent receptor [Prevotellaceae bacterium]|nr:TonB-dependent receptor [Prevotellaceae bacterium]MDD7107119.1 TonB-dependent receptor [Prevotellaceae bacterium]MDY3295984.1 TonB-dependent receptor [Bacteroidaceae bacterium]